MNPARILMDTDLQSDCDDAAALAMLHHYADLEQCEILGVGVCTTVPYAAQCARAINTFYGRPNLPVGKIRLGPGELEPNQNPYTEIIARAYLTPQALEDPVPEAATLYRELLAAQPDGSVTVVAIGFLRNLRFLLESGPDASSALGGLELVGQKVRELVCMGGRFDPPARDEFNWHEDERSSTARAMFRDWPTPITVTDCALGLEVITGPRLLTETPPEHILRSIYALWFGADSSLRRPSWDQTAVLYAVEGLGPWFGSSEDGEIAIGEDGVSRWAAQPKRGHRYLTLAQPEEVVAGAIEDLMVQPPRG